MNADETVALFKHALDSGRVAQGYVVAGAVKGAAREAVDRVLGLLFCTADASPCGRCPGCRQAAAHTHPDLAWIEPEKKSRIISVAQIRDLQQQMLQTSFAGGWKACVIYAADRLNMQAANAFLKLLEEPPERTLFLLLTDSPQFLLQTVVSRCQRLTVSGAGPELLPEWRKQTEGILAAAGKAGPITAMALAERMGRLWAEIKAHADAEIKAESEDEALDEAADTVRARIDSRYKETRKQVIMLMLAWYRDVLMATLGLTDAIRERDGDAREAVEQQAATLSEAQARENLRLVERLNGRLERNVPEAMALSATFAALH